MAVSRHAERQLFSDTTSILIRVEHSVMVCTTKLFLIIVKAALLRYILIIARSFSDLGNTCLNFPQNCLVASAVCHRLLLASGQVGFCRFT